MSKDENTPYSFKGDNAALVGSINALLSLDAKGALVPNGVGGLARQLLESAAERLGTDAQPVAGQSRFTSQKDWQTCSYEHHLMVIANPSEWPGYETRALYARSDAGEVEALREALENQQANYKRLTCEAVKHVDEIHALRALVAAAPAPKELSDE